MLVCKTQGSYFNVQSEVWVPGTVTGLVFMIIDLHLQVPHLSKKLVWFNDLENHFVFQLSNDGALESSQMTMSIGSLMMWNLGNRV